MSPIFADQWHPRIRVSPNAGGDGGLRGLSQWVQLYTSRTGAQINFVDLPPYLTYDSSTCISGSGSGELIVYQVRERDEKGSPAWSMALLVVRRNSTKRGMIPVWMTSSMGGLGSRDSSFLGHTSKHPRLKLLQIPVLNRQSGSENECAGSGSGKNNISGPDSPGSEMNE